jgi:ribosome recycling factor
MINETTASAKVRMTKALEDLRQELSTVRTGRASVGIFDHLRVDYYGAPTPLNQVATLATPEPNLVTLQPWDPTVLAVLEKAIRTSDLGLNPVNDGKILRVPIPPLTEERRRELVKHVHKVLENHRTAVRNIRRDANDELKHLLKDKKISEDDERRALETIQKLTDEYVTKLDDQGKAKETEILGGH